VLSLRDDREKKVSIGWQVVSTLFLPTGMYAFKRINKLRLGGLIYLITYALWVGPSIGLVLVSSIIEAYVYIIIPIIVLVVSFVLPMWYMEKWSKEWNKPTLKELT